MKSVKIVIGLGYGDEGKGLSTDYLCSQSNNPIVIRFNGGQQAGHTVWKDENTSHVFSNFGSGTFRNIPTYWSEYCTFQIPNLLNEYHALINKGFQPKLLLDNKAMLTTHYDVLYNQLLEQSRGNHRHGSCGMGFGSTIERNEVGKIYFNASSLLNGNIQKLLLKIRNYYQKKLANLNIDFEQFDHETADRNFTEQLYTLKKLITDSHIKIVNGFEIFDDSSIFQTYIFEGAQGILLDMDYGHFPHVTRSNTTSQNALKILEKYNSSLLNNIDVYMITRCYKTRHGNGPLKHETHSIDLINTEYETNQLNKYQGNFRYAPLDLLELKEAMNYEIEISKTASHNLIITCTDQLKNNILLVNDLKGLNSYPLIEFINILSENVAHIYISKGKESDKICKI